MIPLVRYETIGCVRVWRTYWVSHYMPPVRAAVLIGCGGFVAGQPLPAAPVPVSPYVAPYVEPAPAWLLPPDVAYAPLPLPWGYEPGAVGGYMPPPAYVAPSAPRYGSGPSAGGAFPGIPDVTRVVPSATQQPKSDHFYSPPELIPDAPVRAVDVPEPSSVWLCLLAVMVLLSLYERRITSLGVVTFCASFWTAVWRLVRWLL